MGGVSSISASSVVEHLHFPKSIILEGRPCLIDQQRCREAYIGLDLIGASTVPSFPVHLTRELSSRFELRGLSLDTYRSIQRKYNLTSLTVLLLCSCGRESLRDLRIQFFQRRSSIILSDSRHDQI